MSSSNRLALPFIDAAQSQKHVTHNEALVALDALVHLSVKSRTTSAPPGTPAEGDLYLVPAGATGAFAGHVDAVAAFDNGGWAWLQPKVGWRAYVESESLFLIFDGAVWKDVGLSLQTLQGLSRLGVGAVADATNPLLAKINNALFTARATGEGGTGDLRIALNKSAAANTVSQLFQTNYSGRAETGLTGDDRYRIKVSSDGATWREAPATGTWHCIRSPVSSRYPSTTQGDCERSAITGSRGAAHAIWWNDAPTPEALPWIAWDSTVARDQPRGRALQLRSLGLR